MISAIEARRYRCLRSVSQTLSPFQILVGPNASGKTTFLDVLALVRDVLEAGPLEAVARRTDNFADLLWGRMGSDFELAVEASLPDDIAQRLNGRRYTLLRYELKMGLHLATAEVGILWENVTLLSQTRCHLPDPNLFPEILPAEAELATRRARPGSRTIVRKAPDRDDHFYSEVTSEAGKGWMPSFRLGHGKSALANLPDDETRFPATTWFRSMVRDGVQSLVLNSQAMRRPSPPGQGRSFRPDGSNLPWVIERLKSDHPDRFAQWLQHVQTALPDLIGIETVERPEDRHRYLMVRFANGETVPSWGVSDGTLRLLALTLPAYLPDIGGIYLIEEPENGIHPQAVETVYQALSSVYNAQLLVASHSPVLLANARLREVLCFGRTRDGATAIVRGDQHPRLKEWHDSANIGLLLASGVL